VPAGYIAEAVPSSATTAAPSIGSMPGMGGMAGAMPAMPAMGEGAVVLTTALTGPPGPSGAGSLLDLHLSDSSTGAPVDDLQVHDEAFIHLAVLGADGSEAHLHPVRTGPGHWQVRFTPAGGGRYGVFAEYSRDGSTHELVRSAVDVPGPPAAPVTPPGPGPRTLPGGTDGSVLDAVVSADDAVAGRPARIRMDLSSGGRPVTDVQSWLGMAGHLFVLGPGRSGAPDPLDVATSFGHVHDMTPAVPGHGFGPEIAFDYTFPTAGTYRLWLQVLRGGSVITVPVDVPVVATPPAA
jgi:hypothetical protein